MILWAGVESMSYLDVQDCRVSWTWHSSIELSNSTREHFSLAIWDCLSRRLNLAAIKSGGRILLRKITRQQMIKFKVREDVIDLGFVVWAKYYVVVFLQCLESCSQLNRDLVGCGLSFGEAYCPVELSHFGGECRTFTSLWCLGSNLTCKVYWVFFRNCHFIMLVFSFFMAGLHVVCSLMLKRV